MLREDGLNSQRHGTALVRAPGCTELVLIWPRTYVLRRDGVFGGWFAAAPPAAAFQPHSDEPMFRGQRRQNGTANGKTRTRRSGFRRQRRQTANAFKALSQALAEVKALPVAHSYLVPVAPVPSLSGHFLSSLVPACGHDRSQKVTKRQWR